MMLAPPGQPLTVPLAVAISPSGHHSGIIYLWPPRGEVFFFHHIGEGDLRHERAAYDRLRWVVPALSVDELAEVRAVVALLEDRYCGEEASLPYGFDHHLRFDAEGELSPVEPGAGLTCATFVAAVFERAGHPLVELSTWVGGTAARRVDDASRQRVVIDGIAVESPRRAAALGRCLRVPFVRAEEVAVASALDARPVAFAIAEAAGALLLDELRAGCPSP